jgi:hypothetical protein
VCAGRDETLPAQIFMAKRICLDLDGIITDIGSRLKEYAKLGSLEFDAEHIGEALLTPDGVDYLEYIFEDPLFWRNLMPIRDSWHAINEWFMMGYDVTFVTARRSETSISEIEPWLDGWRVMYSDIVICEMNHKYEHLSKLNPIFYIDDNPTEIRKIMSELSVPCYVIKTWYNEHLIGKDIPTIDKISTLQVSK